MSDSDTPGSNGKPLNKQLYENSGLRDLFADDDAATAFFGTKEPNLAIMHEKPEHRMLLMLKARGMSNREIAQTMGYTDAWISQLMRQPWARKTLADEITRAGRNEIDTILEGACADSLYKLIELRDAKTTPASVVRATCENLVDRFLGKPRQQVELTQASVSEPASVVELDKQIDELVKEENRLLGRK